MSEIEKARLVSPLHYFRPRSRRSLGAEIRESQLLDERDAGANVVSCPRCDGKGWVTVGRTKAFRDCRRCHGSGLEKVQ